MKPAKVRHTVRHKKTASKVLRPAGPKRFSAISPEARRSTAAALVKHAPGWAGDDLEEVMDIVIRTRAKTRF
jgi:hypothetical protein